MQSASTRARPTVTRLSGPRRCFASVGSCCFACRILLSAGAPCPAPHQPCLAWRQAALSQFSAPETSGISLGVSQNSPKAPLISYSCCTPVWQRAGGSTRSIPTRSIPNPALGGGRDVGGTGPGAGGFLIPGEAPTSAQSKAHFVTSKKSDTHPKGTEKRRQRSLLAKILADRLQAPPPALLAPKGQGRCTVLPIPIRTYPRSSHVLKDKTE